MRMRAPTGSTPSPNRLSRTTDPSTATFAALWTWVVVKKVPSWMSQKRICGNSMSVPWMVVFQFWPAATTWSRVRTPAARYCASGTRSRMASTSSAFSRGDWPMPMLIPPRR